MVQMIFWSCWYDNVWLLFKYGNSSKLELRRWWGIIRNMVTLVSIILWYRFSRLGAAHPNLLADITILFTSRPFLKTAGGIVLGSVAVSAVSADVLPYISVAIKASFLTLGMCNICKNNSAKMFLDFFKSLNCSFERRFLNFLVKNLLRAESQKPLGGFSQNLHCRYI